MFGIYKGKGKMSTLTCNCLVIRKLWEEKKIYNIKNKNKINK